MAIRKRFSKFYNKIKLMLYKSMFKRIKDKGESLSPSEYLCLECIYLMDKPTITEFAEFMDISSPNATYKIKSLINKGFISKEKSERDGREYKLVPTQKYFDLFETKNETETINNLRLSLDTDESKQFDKIIKIIESCQD